MATTPDLSKIVELIMQNPELISTISSLVSKSSESKEEPEAAPEDNLAPPSGAIEATESTETSVQPGGTEGSKRYQRKELLGALKPYLSENRRAAIDSMISISDILSVMRKEGP